MRIRLAIPDPLVDEQTLNALLEATTRAGQRQIERGDVPTAIEAIKRGLKWKPERFVDGEHFDLPVETHRRGWGDCDDLAPWHAASLRATGRDPEAHPVAVKSGPSRWHIRVRRGDGSIDDPSRWAGMGARVSGDDGGIRGPSAAPIALPGDAAMMVLRDQARRGWWGRCDLPFPHCDAHLASVAPASTPQEALLRSVSGALDCCEGVVEGAYADYAMRIAHDLLAHPSRATLLAELVRQAHKHGTFKGTPTGHAMNRARERGRTVVGQFDMLGKMAGGALGGLMGGGGDKGGGGGGAPPAGGGGGSQQQQQSHGGPPILIHNKGGGRGHPLPGGGHIAWQPQGPIIVRF